MQRMKAGPVRDRQLYADKVQTLFDAKMKEYDDDGGDLSGADGSAAAQGPRQ